MKNRILHVAFAFAALAFAGCTQDATDSANPSGTVGNATSTIYAEIAPMTRTSLSDPGEGSSQVLWSAGDEIGVVTADGTIRKAVLAAGAGQSKATFTVEGAVEGESYDYAFYPYVYNGNTASTVEVEGTTMSVDLPVYQTYASDGSVFSSATNTMVASSGADGHFAFQSVLGCLELKLSGSQAVKGITVKNSVTKVAGLATVDLSSKVVTMGTSNTSFSFAYLECPEPVQLSDTPTSFYVLVPAGDYDCLQIGVMTEDGSYVRSAMASHTVSSAVIKPLDCGNLDDMIDTFSAIDLSATGYANCYIVSPEGGEQVYSFEIKKVDGNEVSNSAVAGDDQSPAYAQLVWAEELGIVYDLRFDKAAGRIYFKYNGSTVGNARIVLCNDFFASASTSAGVKVAPNSIIWGWHIWATEAPGMAIVADGNYVKDMNGDGEVTTEDVALSTKIQLMDRNLGATWTAKTISDVENMTLEQATAATGCFYQFGNIHPYPRQKQIGQNVGSFAYSAVKYRFGFSQYSQDWTATSSSKTSVEYNMLYPMYRYAKTYVPSVTGNNTSDKYSNNQWLLSDIIGGNSSADEADPALCLWGGQGSKTNYDPCPAGWVVPHRGNMYQAVIGAVKTVDGESGNVNKRYFHLGPQDGSVLYGTYLTYDGEHVDWFPASGYMGGGNIGSSGMHGYYWSCGYYAESYGTSSTKLQYNMASYQRTANTLSNNATDTQCALSTGYQIRCVKRD